MKILFVAPFYPANPIRFLADTLVDMGHQIYKIGALYNDHGGIDWGKYKATVDLELQRGQKVWDMESYLESCIKAIGSPDICIIGEETYHTKIKNPIGKKLPTALLSFDGWPHVWDRCQLFESRSNWTAHPFGIKIHPRTEPDPRWKYFAPACYPKVHEFLNIPRDIDFVLHATPYCARPRICAHLRDAGLIVRDGIVKTDTYVMNYNRTLSTYVNANAQQEIKWRWAEAAAMGCVNICDETLLYEWIGAQKWIHYIPVDRVFYPDLNEEWPTGEMIHERMMQLKNSPTLAEYISTNARKLVLERHQYLHRAEMILEDLINL